MAKGLAAKVKEHNSKSKHKVTTSMLQSVYNRGVGAYKTNPSSVRPNVSSPEQWAMARVSSFLKIVAVLSRQSTTRTYYRLALSLIHI